MSDRLDVKSLREQLKEHTPEDVAACLAIFVEAAAEHARELRMPIEEFVEVCVEGFAQARGQRVTHFEVTGEPEGIEAVIGIGARWKTS